MRLKAKEEKKKLETIKMRQTNAKRFVDIDNKKKEYESMTVFKERLNNTE